MAGKHEAACALSRSVESADATGSTSRREQYPPAPSLAKSVSEAAVVNVKRVRTRSLEADAWFDAAAAESPRWIERFVEMKTIWHPSGM